MTNQTWGDSGRRNNWVFFYLRFYVPVNSYGHAEMVSSPNHAFFMGKLD